MGFIWIFKFTWKWLTHKTIVHGPNGNFGFDENFTCHIESVWSTLKSYIKRIYNIVQDENFILFLREDEV